VRREWDHAGISQAVLDVLAYSVAPGQICIDGYIIAMGPQMPEWLAILLGFAAYFAVMRWVLPRFGVPT